MPTSGKDTKPLTSLATYCPITNESASPLNSQSEQINLIDGLRCHTQDYYEKKIAKQIDGGGGNAEVTETTECCDNDD